VRLKAVVDGTSGTAARQARALSGFVREGLTGVQRAADGETFAFYATAPDRERLVGCAPTGEVRLARVPPRRLDRMVDILAAAAGDGEASLFVFAGGPTGTELATRLACRTGGAALTGVLDVRAEGDRLLCRKNAYSDHMIASFALSTWPCCVALDPSWTETPTSVPPVHCVVSDADEAAEPGPSPFADVEPLGLPPREGLAGSRFLVVAGGGAGREGVRRTADAAARMGADFGVTRPVAMNAWAPADRLVGVSGARARPEVCIVVGASGAPAFHWGIEKAAFIVAVNTDAQAPMVANADVAVVDDGATVLEALAEIVAPQRSGA